MYKSPKKWYVAPENPVCWLVFGMTPNGCRGCHRDFARINASGVYGAINAAFLCLVGALAIASGCTVSSLEQFASPQFKQNLADADKKCSARTDWPNWESKVSCNDAVEEPVIRQNVPAALAAFQRFSERRRYLAEQADVINAKGIEQSAKYRSSYLEELAVLKAHEPKLADNNSSLATEWIGAQAPSVCRQDTLSKQVECIGSILRLIWERNAPDSLPYYDEYQQKHLRFARNFDASGALETRKRAAEYLTTGISKLCQNFERMRSGIFKLQMSEMPQPDSEQWRFLDR